MFDVARTEHDPEVKFAMSGSLAAGAAVGVPCVCSLSVESFDEDRAGVAVQAMGHPRGMDDVPVTPDLVIPAGELRERFSRSSGPGGQSVNTADSRVELSFDLARSPSLPPGLRERALSRLAGRLVDGVLTIAASEHRTQLANREAARARLAEVLRAALAPPPPPRRPTRPSRGAQQRRMAAKRRRGDTKRNRGTPDEE
jgi:ribosome-associated protein